MRLGFSGFRSVVIALGLLAVPAGGSAQTSDPAGHALPVFRELERLATDRGIPKAERLAAIRGLGEGAHPSVVPTLLTLLADSDPAIRAAAATALGWRGNQAAVEPLLARAGDAAEPPHVRTAAIGALGRIGDPTAVAPVLALAKEPTMEVRKHALLALMQSALAAHSDRVAAAIALLGDLEQEGYNRAQAAIVLGRSKNARAVTPLLKALQDTRTPAGYDALPNPEGMAGTGRVMAERLRSLHNVRAHAAYALGALGARQALPSLLDGLSDADYQVRIQSAAALGLLRSREAAPKLIQAMGDSEARVRMAAASALGLVGDPAAGAALVRALDDQEAEVRERAASALGRLRYAAARPALERLTGDAVPGVRQAAHAALRRLDGEGATR
jgi:HEAT repeat protein